MVSAAVASGRFGSEEMRVGRPRTVERMITSREEPKIPWTQREV